MGKIPTLLTRREFALLAGGTAAALLAAAAGIMREAPHRQALGTTGALVDSPAVPAPSPATSSAPAQPSPATATAAIVSLEDLPWNLRLVNNAHPLPDDFAPDNLAEIAGAGGYTVDSRIIDDLHALLDAASAAGTRPIVCSAYRSRSYQEELFRARVQRIQRDEGFEGEKAEQAAAFWVARPRTSEHELGLAVDLTDAAYQTLDDAQEHTATQRWLIDHCADYGFILRYPTDKSAATGIGYEPWHYRYVGKEAAPAIAESGLCLEEWLDQYLD